MSPWKSAFNLSKPETFGASFFPQMTGRRDRLWDLMAGSWTELPSPPSQRPARLLLQPQPRVPSNPLAAPRVQFPAPTFSLRLLPSPCRHKAVTTPVPPTPPLVPAAAPGPPREKIDAITAAVLAKVTKHLDEAVDTRLKAYAEKVIRFTNQFALRVQANFQDAANRTEDQMVVLIQQKLGALADRVQASRTILESLLARFEALQKNSRTLVEDTEQKIREASHLALESALQELAVNLRKGVEGTSANLGGRVSGAGPGCGFEDR